MRLRLLVAALASPVLLAAQLTLLVVRDGVESVAASPLDLGTVPAGSTADTEFRIRNTGFSDAWLNGLSLSGNRFSFAALPALPLRLGAGEAAGFTVRFSPLVATAHSAYLSVNGVVTVLRANGGEPAPVTPPPTDPAAPAPAPPLPSISIEPQALSGAQVARVSIRFQTASPIDATGRLTVAFTAAVPGAPDDSAIVFPATGARTIAFTVAAGESMARFQGSDAAEVQVGTTAGSLVFTAAVGSQTASFTATVPRGYAVVDWASASRVPAGIQIVATGYDTSRSTSIVSFTFYDATGDAIPPGLIQVDAAKAFADYYAATDLGSVFKLAAVFPVSGDASLIKTADVVFSNSLGSTQPRRLVIR